MITAQKNQKAKPIIVVAGGAGFIGSFLCEALLFQGCQVICLDNLSTGKKENLKQCLTNPDFSFIQKDLTKKFFLDFPKENVYIFDLTGSPVVLQNLMALAQKGNSRVLVVNPGQEKPPLLDYPNLRYVLIESVYGPRMNLDDPGQAAQLIKTALLGKQPASPVITKKFFPVFISDVVYGLIKIMFGITDDKVIKIGGPKFNWSPKVNLSEGIEQTLKYFRKNKTPKKKKLIKNRSLVLAFACLILIVSFPFISLVLNLHLGVSYLGQSKRAIVAGDFKKAEENARLSRAIFKRGVIFSGSLQNFLDVLNLGNSAGEMKKFFNLGEQSAEALEIGSGLGQEGKILFTRVFQNQQFGVNDQSQNLEDLISSIKIKLDQLALKLALIETEVKTNQSVFILARYIRADGLIEQLNKNLPQIRMQIYQAKKGIDLLPILTGTDQPKTYLVLLQNSAELRPTGGFIGSYAILAFNEGKLAGLEVKNVYEADGQLKGHVEPPPALKKHLDIANWYLRDANWSPDFPTSAKKISWFLEKETGQSVDGVIGVDLFLARQLLSVFGEIKLADYQEKITAQNLFEKAEYYSETNFFSGSTQKEEFLGTLTRALFEKIKTADEKNLWRLGQVILENFRAKDIQVALNDSLATKILADLNWDGRIIEIDNQSPGNSVLDYLMIVEANVGVNKANYFVKRKVKHAINIDSEGKVNELLTIIYKNDSDSEKFPSGKYKNYLRILVPLGTNLKEIKLEGRIIEKQNIEEEVIAGKNAFGVLVEVPIQEERTVEISYQLNPQITFDKHLTYFYYWQKQAGIEDEKIELEFVPTQEISVLSASPPAITVGQKYQFSQPFKQDLIFELQLGK